MENTTLQNASPPTTNSTHKEFWYTAFVVVAAAIATGNTVTIAIFTKKRRKNMLLINLATADLIVGLIAVPMYVYLLHMSFYKPTWKDEAFARAYTRVDVFIGLASIFALVLITLERVYAIFWPFKFRGVPARSYWILIAHGWSLAAFLAVLQQFDSRGTWAKYCLVAAILVSLVTIVVAYGSILIKINRAKTGGIINDAFAREKHISLALFTVTSVFLVTWLPFYLLNLIGSFEPGIFAHIPHELIYVTKLLHYGNSFMNPVIYLLAFPEFRTALSNMLCRRGGLSRGSAAKESVLRINSSMRSA